MASLIPAMVAESREELALAQADRESHLVAALSTPLSRLDVNRYLHLIRLKFILRRIGMRKMLLPFSSTASVLSSGPGKTMGSSSKK